MADINQIYQGELLRAAQLQGQTRRAIIEGAAVEVLGQGEKAQQKVVLKLVKVKQRLPLNKTNALALSSAWGPMTDNWVGKTIELRPEKVLFSGSMVDSIRLQAVVAPPQRPTAAAAPAPAPQAAMPLGDAAEPDEWPDDVDITDDIPWEER